MVWCFDDPYLIDRNFCFYYRIHCCSSMSPQTETKASVGFKAGVKEYKLTYYTPEYETKDTDILY
jgi:hypothetical protein